jgi:hypothetical protein
MVMEALLVTYLFYLSASEDNKQSSLVKEKNLTRFGHLSEALKVDSYDVQVRNQGAKYVRKSIVETLTPDASLEHRRHEEPDFTEHPQDNIT